jgi:predicted nucleotide-binding protein
MENLVIFISHRLESTARAREIAGMLCAFGGPRVRVHCSGNYWPDINARERIERDLIEASWFILLYEGPQFEWGWCLYDAGFFKAKMMDSKTDRRLFVLHNPKDEVPSTFQDFNSLPATPDKLEGFFRQIYLDEPWKINPRVFEENRDLVDSVVQRITSATFGPKHLSKKIFIVHGHGGELKEATARLVSQFQLEPVILHEQPSGGRTIIENFSDHAKEADFAIVLLSADDVGREKGGSRSPPLRPRARQNVVFEMGFFFGSLDRKRVCAIHEIGVEIPSDLGGILYVPYDASSGKWRYDVAKELRHAGYDIDMNVL